MKLKKIKKAMAAETLGKYIIFAVLLALIVWGAYLLFKDTLFPWLNSLGLKIGIGGGQSGLNYVRTGVSISSVEANIVKGNDPCPIQIGELRPIETFTGRRELTTGEREIGAACPFSDVDAYAKLIFVEGKPTYFLYPVYIDQERSGGHWVYICSYAGVNYKGLGVMNIEGKTILKAFNYAYFPYFFKPRGWRMYLPGVISGYKLYDFGDVEILKKLNGAYVHPSDLVKLKEKDSTVRLCIEKTTQDINKIWDDVYALVIKKNDKLWILRGGGSPRGQMIHNTNIEISGNDLIFYANEDSDKFKGVDDDILKIGTIDSDRKIVINENYLKDQIFFQDLLTPDTSSRCKTYGLNTGKGSTIGYCNLEEVKKVLNELNGKTLVTKGVGDVAEGIKYISGDDFQITDQLIVFKHG